MVDGPLAGLHVVELAENVSGPYCGKLLADLGAEVIKVEPPECGDASRSQEPFVADRPGSNQSALFLYLNSNKLGVTLDTASPEGRTTLLELLRNADVLLENLGPSVTEERGLSFTSLHTELPELVVTSIAPYGQFGPRRFWKGTELTLWNASGYGVLTPAGKHGDDEPPLHLHCAQVAYLSAANAAAATMAALFDRDLYGEGQHVDISEQETMIAALSPQLADYFYEGNNVWTRDADRLNIMQFIPCKDGYVSLLITQPDQWERLINWMGNPDWAAISEYRGVQGMIQNWDLISFMFAQTFADRSKEELFADGQAHRIPIAPVNAMAEVVALPHLAERGYFVTTVQGEAGRVTMPGAPYRFSETPWQIRRPAPALGQHNEEVYGQRLGYASEALIKLRKANVI